jgi:predicted DCC family thiol-disulfide oxidoreductase YuxK
MVAANMTEDGTIMVFDGICNLCSATVRFVLRHDKRGRIRFASMQSRAGRELLRHHGLDASTTETFLLIKGSRAYLRSDAVLEIAKDLGGWRWLRVLRLLPRAPRDWLYTTVARNRYRWFGKRTTCYAPTFEQRARFLTDDYTRAK